MKIELITSWKEIRRQRNFTIRNINLEIEDKDFCVYSRPSGCGKSTLLRMISVIDFDYGGRYVLRWEAYEQRRAERQRHRDGIPVVRTLSAT